jgi:hypothetical protein
MCDGRPDRRCDAWTERTQRTQARAETARQHGHAVSAREATLRAYPYYRAALLFMGPRTIPALDRSAASTACLRTAATLLDPPFEVVAIPVGGATLPGYFLKRDASGTPRPALLMIGSGDTVVEAWTPTSARPGSGAATTRNWWTWLARDLPLRAGDAAARQGADARGGALGRPESDSKRLVAYRHQRRRAPQRVSAYEVLLHLLGVP